jgi:hypothetical protein
MGFPMLETLYTCIYICVCGGRGSFIFIYYHSALPLMLNLQVKMSGKKRWDEARIKCVVQVTQTN